MTATKRARQDTAGGPAAGWRARLVADAATDGLPRRWAFGLVALPVAGAVLFAALFAVARPSFYSLQREDHVVEWAQFALLLLALGVSLLAAAGFRRAGRPGLAALMVLVALGLLVLAGEEISWGQRVLGLVTPTELSGINHQSEMNVHNIDVGLDLEDLFKAVEAALGLVAAGLALVVRSRGPRRTTDRAGAWWVVAPPLVALPGFVAIAVYRATVLVLDIAPVVAFQEYVELTLYFSLALTALAYLVRSGAVRSPLPVMVVVVLALVTTVVLATATRHSGVLPGNLPGLPSRPGG